MALQKGDYRGPISDDYQTADTFDGLKQLVKERDDNSRIVVWSMQDLIPDEWGYTPRGYKYSHVAAITMPRILLDITWHARKTTTYRSLFFMIRQGLLANGHRIAGRYILIDEDRKEITGIIEGSRASYVPLGALINECEDVGIFSDFQMVKGFVGPSVAYMRGSLRGRTTRFMIRSMSRMIMITTGPRALMRRFQSNKRIWIRALRGGIKARLKTLQEAKTWLETNVQWPQQK